MNAIFLYEVNKFKGYFPFGSRRAPDLFCDGGSRVLLVLLVLPFLLQDLPNGSIQKRARSQEVQGSLVAFIRDGNIWVIGPDGSSEQQITSSGGYAYPALSPDGSQIAYTKGTAIGILNRVDKQERDIVLAEKTPFTLLNSYYTYSFPSWSPDGKSLYFIASDGRVQGDSIRKVDLVSGAQVRDVVLHPRGMDVSTRNGKLAYVIFGNAPPVVGNGVEVSNPDGSNASPLLPIQDVGINDLCWSWDETSIIFSETTTGGDHSLKLARIDQESTITLIDSSDAPMSWIACSPRDNSLVYEANGILYIYDAETRTSRMLTLGSQPSWERTDAIQAQIPCGHWEWVGPKENKDLRIKITPQTIDPTDDCAGVFHLENNTAFVIKGYAFAGEYTFDLRTSRNNASIGWTPAYPQPYRNVYLPPTAVLVLTAVPDDPAKEAAIEIRGNLSWGSLKQDLVFFLINKMTDVLPCIQEDKILIGVINIANTKLLDPVVEPLLKWPPDLKKSKAELDAIWEKFWLEVVKEFVRDCEKDLLMKAIEEFILKKAELFMEIYSWAGRILKIHYIDNWGEDAIVNLKYTPAQITQPTQIVTFQPSGVTGQELMGACWTFSIASPRDGAWRCMSNSQIFDPCFSPQGETDYVICGALPLGETRGFKLNLTESLPEETPPSQTSSVLALELEDGTTCRFLTTGTLFAVEGKYFNYGCSDGSVLLDVEPGEVWTATKASLSSDKTRILETVQVRIKIVWV